MIQTRHRIPETPLRRDKNGVSGAHSGAAALVRAFGAGDSENAFTERVWRNVRAAV